MSVKILIPFLFSSLVLLWVLTVFILSIIAYRQLFFPHIQSLEHAKNYGLDRGEFDEDFLNMPWEYCRIPAEHRGTELFSMMIAPLQESPAAGTALFVHGITWNRYGMLKYMKPFVEKGWRVISLDLGGHGDSPAGRFPGPSYGYYEKMDVEAAVQWIHNTFDSHRPLILVGESMGAATVLQYAPIGAPSGTKPRDRYIDAIIADCPYSSADDELVARLKANRLPAVLYRPVVSLVSLYSSVLRGYPLNAASPKQAVMNSDIPILFIHGALDTFVPTWMSEHMASERRKAVIGVTELLIVHDASHAKSILADRDMWFSWVFDFLSNYLEK